MGPIEQLLRNAYKKIEKPENWCQGSYAQNSHGERVSEISPKACSWCLVGSLCAQYNQPVVPEEHVKVFRLLKSSVHQFDGETVMLHIWNDRSHRHHTDVLAVLATAAEMAATDKL